MRYLFDSDVLITAKNIHYKPEFCPAFWKWIVDGHKAGVFFSVDKVKGELLTKEDPLHHWVQLPELSHFFIDSKAAIVKWTELSVWANDPAHHFMEAAKAKFLNYESADAWLIATAAHQGGLKIITNEVSAPESKRAIKLPDAAAALGVQTIALSDVLSMHAGPHFKFNGVGPALA